MSTKQLFYEGRIMELQSILNDILSISQVDLFWKAWPWQSDTAGVILLNFMSTIEIAEYCQYNKIYLSGFRIFWILTHVATNTYAKDSPKFLCYACCIKTKYSLHISSVTLLLSKSNGIITKWICETRKIKLSLLDIHWTSPKKFFFLFKFVLSETTEEIR